MNETITIDQYKKIIDKHPWNTFGKCEIEQFMGWFLRQCIEAGDIDAEIKTRMNEDYLCDRDILIKVAEQTYRLSESSKAILLKVYKREFLEPEDFEV